MIKALAVIALVLFGVFAIVYVAIAASSLLIMFGWSLFVPSVFGLTLLSFDQAFGLALLTWVIGTLFMGSSVARVSRK